MKFTEFQHTRFQQWLYLAGLMIAGESIYMLPYMRKTFQTSMESVFQITSTEIGLLNSMFGILAVVCYFPSGWVADRFSARKLLTFSLIATSLGGIFMFFLPSYGWLLVIHAFWGITSILTFWAALIKATRNWGHAGNQGTSFGFLDAGRGAVAAILASLATAVFAISGSVKEGLQWVIVVYSLAPFLVGILIWWVIPESFQKQGPGAQISGKMNVPGNNASMMSRAKQVSGRLDVWLLAFIIFAAYMLYLGSYDFPAFAERAYGQTKTFGATLGTIRDWMRPIAAIGAGLLADKIRASTTIEWAFLLLALVFGSLFFISPSLVGLGVLWIQVILGGAAVFALRGVYFAMLEELSIPQNLTGTTVGLVSFIGFMPDMFSHFLSGWFVDTFEGIIGYHYYFGFLGMVALFGLFTALVISRKFRKV